MTSAIFQFFTSYFASLLLVYWDPQHFSSLYFTLLAPSLHIDICSISVLYILLCFFCLWILTSAVLEFCIFYLAFFVCSYWHLQYFNFANFTMLSSSLHIHICSNSVLYILPCLPRLCILVSAVFKFCIFYFILLVSAY